MTCIHRKEILSTHPGGCDGDMPLFRCGLGGECFLFDCPLLDPPLKVDKKFCLNCPDKVKPDKKRRGGGVSDKVFLVGNPGELGGACTEAWHTVKLWRQFGLPVEIIPTWGMETKWQAKIGELGCPIHSARPETLASVPGLAGAVVVSFCNGEFLKHAAAFHELGCRVIWSNCMTWMFDAERDFYRQHGPFAAYHFQSDFQRSLLEPELTKHGYSPEQGHLIRGAFDVADWPFQPRLHGADEPFVVGRASRPDQDKWSSHTWPIYSRIQYRHRRALMLGMDDKTHEKCGTPPTWADCLKPTAIPAVDFFRQLHCTLPINGGARENWPRVGLEAMAAGVPIVAQNEWGWREMVQHGVTGFLGNCDEELAHFAALLAYDEELRLRITRQARQRLVDELANPYVIWLGWQRLFQAVGLNRSPLAPRAESQPLAEREDYKLEAVT